VRCWHQRIAASRRLPQPPSRASSQAAEPSPRTVQACMQMPIVRRPTQRAPIKQPTAIGRLMQTRGEPTRHRPLRKLPTLRRTKHNTDRTIRRPIRRIQTRHIRIVRTRTTITPRLTRTRAIRASPGVNPPAFSRLLKARARPWPFSFSGVDSVGIVRAASRRNAACLPPGSRERLPGALGSCLCGSLGNLQNGFMLCRPYAVRCGAVTRFLIWLL